MIYSSDEHWRLFCLDPRDGLPSYETLVQRMHPEDRGSTLDRLEKAIREGTDFEVDCRLVLPDGVVKFVHGVGHPVLSASGELIRFFGTTVAVTERKRADEEREQLLLRERAAWGECGAAQQRFTELAE